MEFYEEAFYGDDRNQRKTITVEPYNYLNNLTMMNLPSLRTMIFKDNYNFIAIGRVILHSR